MLDELCISREIFNHYTELAGIKLALSLAYNVSLQDNEAVAIGYMLVNEDMTQITYSDAKSALSRYYPEMQTPFFDIHIDVDEKHVNELYVATRELHASQEDDLLFGVQVGERGMASLLDEAYGVFDYCASFPQYDPQKTLEISNL